MDWTRDLCHDLYDLYDLYDCSASCILELALKVIGIGCLINVLTYFMVIFFVRDRGQ